jgi:predicted metal-dependent HD superfamily phosphohydrolase
MSTAGRGERIAPSLPPSLRHALQRSWQRAWSGLGAAGAGEATLSALLQRYEEPGRAYHTLQHLGECFELFEQARALAGQPAAVEMALWFHDAIYDPHRKDNEELSAEWARSALGAAGVDAVQIERVAALVLATRHVQPPEPGDAALLVDIDLAILGSSEARFAEYERQIRIEYGFVPADEFAIRRRAVLGSFLARPSIYGTPYFNARFEASARRNLTQALAGLPPVTCSIARRGCRPPPRP